MDSQSKKLEGKRVAVLATNGFEQSELEEPVHALRQNGAEVDIVSPEAGKIRGWKNGEWGKEVKVDKTLDTADTADYDALVLPGGVMNPDHLRMNEDAVAFVRGFFHENSQKPVAAICHGPWMLINAHVANGRRLTSYESLKEDLMNAGADWVDEEVVVDKGLVTSRSPKDLAAFNQKMIEEICEGAHQPAQ